MKRNTPPLKKIFFFSLLFIFVGFTANATNTLPNHKMQISILTCAAGEDIYTAWGHTAIRVIDSVNNTDLVYNFGTFDFSEPFFLAKFVKGSLEYFISVNRYGDFLAEYQYYSRDVVEQVLKLTDEEKANWHNALQVNLVGANRFYLYNFITDNCTTRVKDGLFKNSNRQPAHIPVNSFRDEIVKAPYQQGIPWIGFGIDLLLGAYSDQQPDHFKSGFLPPLFFNQLANIKGLVIKTNTNKFSGATANSPINQPFIVLVCIFLFYAFVSKWNTLLTQRIAKLIDVLLLFLFGIGGCLVFYMSLISLHTACYENFNLMWLHPAYLIALVLYFLPQKWIGQAGMLFFSAIVGLLITSYWLPQHFSKEVFALMAIALLLNYRLIIKGHYAKIV